MKTFLTNLFFFTFLLLANNSLALSVEEKLPNEQQEQRAMNLFLQVRCLVCNGQVIENSDAEFAFEMRKLIRKKISQNLTDEEIKKYLKDNFGNDILTEVSSENGGYFLWILPLIFTILTLFFLRKSIFPNRKS